MLGLLILISIAAVSFGAGYWTRERISRKRRAHYLKWEPYVRSSPRPTQPPAFLVHPTQTKQRPYAVDGARVASGR
ncbi:hypothetical protein [Bradyrhizobium guangdongense]|uniref:hypothetical protein n=1 Tax=Bradyrhizobium guangdongense TaxID=1325090 RepID=UPI00112894B0|nr:hypothetical protein [Bradyrhizobium guangdongense]